MKKGIVIAVLAVFSVFAVGPAFAAINADGTMTVDKPAAKFPAKKLNADGTKKKNPVTFNHKAHGEKLGCQKCHHTEADLKAGATAAKACFDCHGPEAKDKQPDTYDMIHKAGCIGCHAAAQGNDWLLTGPLQ